MGPFLQAVMMYLGTCLCHEPTQRSYTGYLKVYETTVKPRLREKHTDTVPPLFIPVLHEADFPFAGDLLCGALDREGGGWGHDHSRGDGAGGGCSDLIGLDVTWGSWKVGLAESDETTLTWRINVSLACSQTANSEIFFLCYCQMKVTITGKKKCFFLQDCIIKHITKYNGYIQRQWIEV